MTDPVRAALRLQRAAARRGFDWPRQPRWERELWSKLQEEIGELRAVRRQPRRALEELGDLLFMAINVARFLDLDPSAALRGANRKFQRRYFYILRHAASLPPPGNAGRLQAMERLWNEAKARERPSRTAIRQRRETRGPRRGSRPR